VPLTGPTCRCPRSSQPTAAERSALRQATARRPDVRRLRHPTPSRAWASEPRRRRSPLTTPLAWLLQSVGTLPFPSKPLLCFVFLYFKRTPSGPPALPCFLLILMLGWVPGPSVLCDTHFLAATFLITLYLKRRTVY
jgi:hypothetical protein